MKTLNSVQVQSVLLVLLALSCVMIYKNMHTENNMSVTVSYPQEKHTVVVRVNEYAAPQVGAVRG